MNSVASDAKLYSLGDALDSRDASATAAMVAESKTCSVGYATASTTANIATACEHDAATTTGTTEATAGVDSSSTGNNAPGVDDKHDTSDNTATEQQQQQQEQQQDDKHTLHRVKQPCVNCHKPTTKLCRACAAVYYCSIDCQKVCFSDAQHRAQCEAQALKRSVK
jgi:hypothetical protein